MNVHESTRLSDVQTDNPEFTDVRTEEPTMTQAQKSFIRTLEVINFDNAVALNSVWQAVDNLRNEMGDEVIDALRIPEKMLTEGILDRLYNTYLSEENTKDLAPDEKNRRLLQYLSDVEKILKFSNDEQTEAAIHALSDDDLLLSNSDILKRIGGTVARTVDGIMVIQGVAGKTEDVSTSLNAVNRILNERVRGLHELINEEKKKREKGTISNPFVIQADNAGSFPMTAHGEGYDLMITKLEAIKSSGYGETNFVYLMNGGRYQFSVSLDNSSHSWKVIIGILDADGLPIDERIQPQLERLAKEYEDKINVDKPIV